MQSEASSSLPEQYVHAIDISAEDSDAGAVVITMLSGLAECIHDSDYATFDMTFKRINSKNWNEWELVVWCKQLMRRAFFFFLNLYASRLQDTQACISHVAISLGKPGRRCV
jgi:hypothetical protein